MSLEEVIAAKPRGQVWWDKWFLGMCEYVSSASKDPSTQVGAVIIRPNRTIASIGYNGFPRSMSDTSERLHNRDDKYARIIHGEMNAILNSKEDLRGYHIYIWPFCPCSRCAVHIIQSGIRRVISYQLPEHLKERWQEDTDKALSFFREVGVEYILY